MESNSGFSWLVFCTPLKLLKSEGDHVESGLLGLNPGRFLCSLPRSHHFLDWGSAAEPAASGKIEKFTTVSVSPEWSRDAVCPSVRACAERTTCSPADSHTFLCSGCCVTSLSPSPLVTLLRSLVTVGKKRPHPPPCKETTPVNEQVLTASWSQQQSLDTEVFNGPHFSVQAQIKL